jgi:hypothetical protein
MGYLDTRERLFSFRDKNETQGVSPMEDKEKKDLEEKSEKKRAEPLPFCTNAPSPEHARGMNDDEPCDDSRSGS